jgi:diamine N-acetyltransferase
MSLDTDIVIRLGEPKDAADLSKLAEKLFVQTYTGMIPANALESYVTEAFSYPQQLTELEDINVTSLLVEHAGDLVGYAQVCKNAIPVKSDSSVVMELSRIYIDQSCHGMGIGKLLLTKVMDMLKSQSCEQIWLGVWDKNLQAISFYKKHGFSVAGTQKFSIGNKDYNDFVMLGSISSF